LIIVAAITAVALGAQRTGGTSFGTSTRQKRGMKMEIELRKYPVADVRTGVMK
jgi:hypothetical protein